MRAKAIGALILVGLLPASALAQQPSCGPMPEVRRMLTEKYGETEIRQGVSDRGYLLRLFMAPDGATWTIVGERPGTGAGCIVDSGSDLREPPVVEPEGSGA